MAAGKVVVYADGKLTKTSSNQDATIDGNLIISGNLSVTGTSTTVNVEDLNVENGEITLNYAAGDSSASANGAGIRIQDAVDASTDATILWDGTNDEFDFSHAINVTGNISVSGTVDGRDLATDGSKLDGIESGADVTDAANVTSSLVAATSISSADKTSIQTNLDVDPSGTDNSTDVTLAASIGDVFSLSTQEISAVDFGSDAFVGWDETNNKLTYLAGLDTDTSLGGGSAADNVVPSQLAVKTYVDSSITSSSVSVAAGTNIGVAEASGVYTVSLDNSIALSGGEISFGNGQNAAIIVDAVTGPDTAGKGLKLSPGQSTGQGAGGSVTIQGGTQGPTSGSSANALVDVAQFSSGSVTLYKDLAAMTGITYGADGIGGTTLKQNTGLNAASGKTIADRKFVTVAREAATSNSTMIIGMHIGNTAEDAGNNKIILAAPGQIVNYDTSGVSAGSQVFLSSSGGITSTPPTSNEVIQIGWAITAANPGKLFLDIKHIMSN